VFLCIPGDNVFVGLNHLQNPPRKAPRGQPGHTSVGSCRRYRFSEELCLPFILVLFFLFSRFPDNFRGQWKNRNQLIQYHHLNKNQGIKTVSMVSQDHKILKYLQHHSNELRPKQNENYTILNHVILCIIILEFPNSCAPALRLDQGCVSTRPTFTTSFFLYKPQ